MSQLRHRYRSPTRALAATAMAVAAVLVVSSARAGDATWTGGSGSWTVGTNWTPPGIPNANTTNVFIDGNASAASLVTLSSSVAVGTLAIDLGDRLELTSGGGLTLNGNARIDGTLALSGSGSSDLIDVVVKGARTLDGGGSLVLGNLGTLRLYALQVDQPLTLGSAGSAFLVQGAGQIGADHSKIVNRATIEANQTAPMSIVVSTSLPDTFVNEGVLRAASGATLKLVQGSFNNSGGIIQALDASFVELAGGISIRGGTLSSSGSGLVRTAGTVTLDNVTVQQGGVLDVQGGHRLDVKSLMTNNGRVQLDVAAGAPLGTVADLQVVGDSTLAGNGEIVLHSAGKSRVYADVSQQTGPSRLTIGAGQTIRGTGNLGADRARIVNEGSVVADAATALTIDTSNLTDGFINRGSIRVHSGSTLSVESGAGFIQDAAGAKTEVFGTLSVQRFDIQAGTLTGTGTVLGAVANNGGSVAPGASPGTLTIVGNYTQGPAGQLTLEFNGTDKGSTYDWLNVGGSANLAGSAVLDFGFTPLVGTAFVVLTAAAGITGKFDSIVAPKGWQIQDSYMGNNVTLTVAAVPEPEIYALMLAGLAFMAWAARRRRG